MANKTKELIVDCFLSLVDEKPVDKISVTDLVEQCNISRQTFYYHFESIDEMLRWAFHEETNKICAKDLGSQKWVKACSEYLPFLTKYSSLLKSSATTTLFAYICNLLAESTYKFSCQYHKKQTKKPIVPDNTKFILKCTSLSFTGLIIEEFQKENPNYRELMNRIETVFDIENK